MTFKFSILENSTPKNYTIEPGTSLFFVGANGGGKTRLAVSIEEELGEKAHRISAHRALALNPNVPKINEVTAINRLRFGTNFSGPVGVGNSIVNRSGDRWGNQAATQLLNDFDCVVQALFAEQTNTALKTHDNFFLNNGEVPSETKFQKLRTIWDRVLSHRKLHITGDDIKVSAAGSTETYAAQDMSDGERAVFYLIGQTLVAAAESLIIFDEPELHIHRAIIARLWDELEAARPDCAMVMISHDLEFAASRQGQKFVLMSYEPATGWIIEPVPEDSGFSEDITTLILGSRKPVLFVEGESTSLDKAIYRACYPDWTIIPKGSCAEVIHAVTTMRANSSLTRITCAGIVDADGHHVKQIEFLQSMGVSVLPVSEIENLFLLPDVIIEIAKTNSLEGDLLTAKCNEILDELFKHAKDNSNQTAIIMRYCRRRIDHTLKKIDLSSAKTVEDLAAAYSNETSSLNISEIANVAAEAIKDAIANKDATELLKWYDNKGSVLSIACKARQTSKRDFVGWLTRSLNNKKHPELSKALFKHLPEIQAS